MTPEDHPNVATARRYLAAIEGRVDAATLTAFFTPDVVQEEFPNRLLPNGARRDLAALIEGSLRGRQVMSAERYDVHQAIAMGERVALEVTWTGTLAIAFGTLAVGDTMRARFGVFLDFRGGRICGQRNYDCFDPW